MAELLTYAHYRLVAIHPSANGNGRTARLFTNLLAHSCGYQEVVRYPRQVGEARTHYRAAIRQADGYDLRSLRQLSLLAGSSAAGLAVGWELACA